MLCPSHYTSRAQVFGTLNDHYPHVEQLFIINAPSLFGSIWSIVSTILDKDIRDSTHILGTGPGAYLAALQACIAPEHIPLSFGGQDPTPFGQAPEHEAMRQWVQRTTPHASHARHEARRGRSLSSRAASSASSAKSTGGGAGRSRLRRHDSTSSLDYYETASSGSDTSGDWGEGRFDDEEEDTDESAHLRGAYAYSEGQDKARGKDSRSCHWLHRLYHKTADWICCRNVSLCGAWALCYCYLLCALLASCLCSAPSKILRCVLAHCVGLQGHLAVCTRCTLAFLTAKTKTRRDSDGDFKEDHVNDGAHRYMALSVNYGR